MAIATTLPTDLARSYAADFNTHALTQIADHAASSAHHLTLAGGASTSFGECVQYAAEADAFYQLHRAALAVLTMQRVTK